MCSSDLNAATVTLAGAGQAVPVQVTAVQFSPAAAGSLTIAPAALSPAVLLATMVYVVVWPATNAVTALVLLIVSVAVNLRLVKVQTTLLVPATAAALSSTLPPAVPLTVGVAVPPAPKPAQTIDVSE